MSFGPSISVNAKYRLKVEIVDFPGGMPGDVGMTLKWG